jgi:hypothetical protein
MKTCTWCKTHKAEKGWFVRQDNILWQSCRMCSCVHSTVSRPPTVSERFKAQEVRQHKGECIALVLIHKDYI